MSYRNICFCLLIPAASLMWGCEGTLDKITESIFKFVIESAVNGGDDDDDDDSDEDHSCFTIHFGDDDEDDDDIPIWKKHR